MLRIATFTFNPFQENTYVVHDGKHALVVDPGCWNGGEEHELERYFADNALYPTRLVLTHAHIDHVFGCAWMHARYGLLPELHTKDLDLLRAAPQVGTMYGVHCEAAPVPQRFLEEGDEVRMGDDVLKVLFVPGHAPGHIALFCAAQRFVIAGDVLFKRSIGRTDLPGGDFTVLERSIRRQLYPLGDDVLVHCGHGPSTTIGEERLNNPFVKDR